MTTQSQPRYMQVHPAYYAMWQRMVAEDKAFKAIFTPAGLMALFHVKRTKQVLNSDEAASSR